MPTFISLVTYTDAGMQAIKDSPKRLELAKQALKDQGGEVKHFYLTMGAYDAVLIFEAPSDEAAATFLLAVGAQRRVTTVTMKAFPEPDYRKIIEALP